MKNNFPHSRICTTAVLVISLLITSLGYSQSKPSVAQRNSTGGTLSAQEIARRVLPAVPLLLCDDGKRVSQGSGFFIRPGVLLTSYHIIEGMARGLVRIRVRNSKEKRNFRIVRVLGFDEESDLALLSIPEAKKAGLPVLSLIADPKKVEVGETIYALGNPEGLVGTISPGIVSAELRSSHKRARLQITAPISHGSSGGPVVNTRGEVIGVAVGSLSEGQNLNFAVPIQLIAPLVFQAKWPDKYDDLLDEMVVEEGPDKGARIWPESSKFRSASKTTSVPPISVIGPLRQGETKERASLRKLEGVYLTIETLDPDAQSILSESQIQTEVELRLRRNRVRLLTKDEWLKSPGNPYLYLRLDVLRSDTTGVYSYAYKLELNQSVLLERDPQFEMLATTWQKSSMGFAGSRVASSAIREAIGQTVDEFCNEFLAAN